MVKGNGKIVHSEDYAQIENSGKYEQIGSSGDYTQIESSGEYAQIASSGKNAKIVSFGYYAQIASSGNGVKIKSPEYLAKIASSGYNAQIESSGYDAQIASSGNYAKIESSGRSSIGFACGYKTIMKAKEGTWIALAEYTNNIGSQKPIYAKVGQIGNKEYKDNRGKILSENNYYCLYNKEFHIVEEYDGIKTIKISDKKIDNMSIIKAIDYNSDEKIYIVKEGDLTAHGETIREAYKDLQYKKIENIDRDKIIKKIKESGKVTRNQYRAITGACNYGTNEFCKKHGIENLKEIKLSELRKILIDDYGAKKFWNLIDGGKNVYQ